MLKIRSLTFILMLLLGLPGVTYALSLGNIKIHSHFAQPFSAEIDIPSYTSDELENLEVKLADEGKFETLGLEILPYMRELIFSIENKPNGVPFIKIYSKTPIKELSISFVIEASWVGGKIIKDFHSLLTPEAITQLREERFLQKQLSVVEAQPTELAKKEPVETVQEQPSIEPAVQTVAQAPAAPSDTQRQARSSSNVKKFGANGVQYNVGRGETLSQIAMKIRDDKSVSLHQAMVALYEQNLNAFVDQNINKLKAGSQLTIQDLKDLKEKSKREAFKLAQQYLKGPAIRNEPESVVAEAEAPVAQPAIEDEKKGARLEISSASEEAVPLEILEKLKQEQIATTEEELANARKTTAELEAQNEELRERIANLESRMDDLSIQLFQANTSAVPSEAPSAASATQQIDDLIVTNTDVALKNDDHITFIERIKENQMTLSIMALVFLTLTLIIVRKKDAIRNAIENFKDKPEKKTIKKPKTTITSADIP